MPAENPGQENPPAKKRSGPTAEQKGYSTSEAIIELCDTLISENDANRKQQDRKPKRKPSWVEIATLVLLFSTTFGLAVQDGILYSSDTTFKATLDNQKQSNERQLRAYVGVVPGAVENFGDTQKQVFTIIRKNYGRSPAYNVFTVPPVVQVIHVGDNIGAYATSGPAIIGGLTMFPSMEVPFAERTANISQQQFDLARAGTEYQLVYYGAVYYDDIFGKKHYTRYCYLFKGQSMTAKDADICLGHNDSN